MLAFYISSSSMASISATNFLAFQSSSMKLFKRGTVSHQVTGRIGPMKLAPLPTSRFRVSCMAKPETIKQVCDIVRKQLALPTETELTPESKFSALGADSLDTVEIVMMLEEEFDINVDEENSQNITTVQEVADLIDKLVLKKADA